VGVSAVSIDAKIRSVMRDGETIVLHLEPRFDGRVNRFTLAGQERLRIVPPITRMPDPGLAVWGNSGTVVVVQRDHSEWRYERVGTTRMREVKP
jgi:hypothetical protein